VPILVVGGLLLLPVLLIIIGFDLVALMAVTAWSPTVWWIALAALAATLVVWIAVVAKRAQDET
jgi:hypothetical protein